MDAETFRDGVFSLRTRRLGKVGEMLIERLLKLGKGKSLFHDLFDDAANKRVEVKFSVVSKKSEVPITEKTVLQAIEGATGEKRMVPFSSWQGIVFDCNIQQVKKAEFDLLYYGLFFSDRVVIFRIASEEIGPQIQYSDKQHKGNIGEGQFHINQRTLPTHLEKYHYKTLTYQEFLKTLQ